MCKNYLTSDLTIVFDFEIIQIMVYTKNVSRENWNKIFQRVIIKSSVPFLKDLM